MNILELVGERIRSVRTQRKLSQQALAEKAGLSYKHVGEVERGQVNVSLETLHKMAVAMDIEVCALLADLCEKSQSHEYDRAITLLQMLDDKGIAMACELLEVVGRHAVE